MKARSGSVCSDEVRMMRWILAGSTGFAGCLYDDHGSGA